jgi:hypothetical protein
LHAATEQSISQKGANGRLDGCTNVIQCFDPVRHYGATAGRFHNFINLCLANRVSTILAKQRHNPICDPRNLSIANGQESEHSPELVGEVGEAYLLRNSGTFARECRRRTHAENPVLKAYIREFEQFVLQREPKLLAVVYAIERGTFHGRSSLSSQNGSGKGRTEEGETGTEHFIGTASSLPSDASSAVL